MKKKYTIILIVVSVILILALAIGLSVGLQKNDKNEVASASAEGDEGGDDGGGVGPPAGPLGGTTCTSSSTQFCVTVVGGKFYIDGAAPSNGAITITRGETYTFDQSDSSNSGQPNLDILDTSNFDPFVGYAPYNTNGECSSCVTFNGTPGQSGASTVFAVPSNNSVNLRYGSGSTNMGATFLIDDASATIPPPP